MKMHEQLINVNEAAKLLGISTRHVSRLKDRGEIPEPIKQGRRKLWPLSEILEYIENLKAQRV